VNTSAVKVCQAADSHHKCTWLMAVDMYWAYYEFRLPEVTEVDDDDEDEAEDELKIWGLRYKVKGLQKDYTSDTAYERTYAASLPIRSA
jgi:hypothetical protein